jgi:hypothetical protein
MQKQISISRCPRCSGEGKIWDFGDPEEPNFYWCELCQGKTSTINN